MKKKVDATGRLHLVLDPDSEGKIGLARYSLKIDKIYSNLDRFWEAYDDECSEFIATGNQKDLPAWEPPIIEQQADFVQSQHWKEQYKKNCRKREKDFNVGEIRYVGNVFTVTEDRSQSRNRTIEVRKQTVKDDSKTSCLDGPPAPETIIQDKTFNQTRNCTEYKTETTTYSNNNIKLKTVTNPYSETVNYSRTAVGTGTWQFLRGKSILRLRSESHRENKDLTAFLNQFKGENWGSATNPTHTYVGGNICAKDPDGQTPVCSQEPYRTPEEDNFDQFDPVGTKCPLGAQLAYDRSYIDGYFNETLYVIGVAVCK